MTPQPRKRPRSSYVRFAAGQPNECWQADFTHYPLADGTGTEVLTWLDDHSRLAAVFRGLLDEPLIPEQAGAPRRRRNAAMQRDADPIQVAATGRILVVVAGDATQDPHWSEVTSRIE